MSARFESMVGLDDAVRTGVWSVTFEIWADDRLVTASGLMRAGDAARRLSAASGLPDGLALDARTGIISGSIRERGRSEVQLSVKGPAGVARRALAIIGDDDALARTPPMGWNSWNVWGPAVDAAKIRRGALLTS